MKNLLILVTMLLATAAAKAQISDVQQKGALIYVFGDNGREISRMNTGNNEIVGVAGSFFVVINGALIYVYDEKCKEISRMNVGNKVVRGASGNSFTVKEGSLIYVYDKFCKEISRRNAN